MRKKLDDSGEILLRIFGLKALDVRVYRMLLKYGPVKIDSLAKKMGRERTTIYRSLSRLLSAGLCHRKEKDVASGGRYHLYSPSPKHVVARKMRSEVKKYAVESNKLIRKFEREF